jgi:exonuclease-1
MTWLYKGAYSCATELGLDQHTVQFLNYPIKMLRLVQSFGIRPVCVFDGMQVQAKAATERTRSDGKK